MTRSQAAQRGSLIAPDIPAELLADTFRTLWIDGKPEALVGIVLFWPGCARGVALFTDRALTFPVALSLATRRWIRFAFRNWNLRRLEITVDARHEVAHRWARTLGFRPEGRMEAYGPDGSCHCLYARFG